MAGPGPHLAGIAPANDPVAQAGYRVSSSRGGVPGASSRQKKTFALTERVSAAFAAFTNPRGVPADTDPSTLDTGISADSRTFAWQEYFKVDNTRLQVYEDVKEMDETTDEVSAALDTLADSAVNAEDGSQHTFEIEIDQGQYRDRAEAIFDQVTESCDLHRLAFTIARDFLKYGDCFVELVVDESMALARSKILPPGSIWRNEDAAGNLQQGQPRYDTDGRCTNEAGECAFDQREALNGKLIAAFTQWQITHFRYNHRGTERYGRSLLRTARLVWKKLRAAEESLVIARLQRAWMRFVHYVDTTGMPREEARRALMTYRQELTRRFIVDTQLRESPFEVTSDFYLSSGYLRDLDGNKYLEKKAKIEVLQGDHAVLAAITDIEYFQNKLFASLRVPKAYLGFERDVNSKSTLTTQDIQFARTLRRIQAVLSEGYKEIFDFALQLGGINPADVSYTVRWPAILVSDEERDAIIRQYHARADAVYWQMGMPSTKFLVQDRYGMDDEAYAVDMRNRAFDPPPRLIKMPLLGMAAPGGQQMMDPTPGAPTLADAIKGNLATGALTDVPPDSFDQSRATTDMEKRASLNINRLQGRNTGGAPARGARAASRSKASAGGGTGGATPGTAGQPPTDPNVGGSARARRMAVGRSGSAGMAGARAMHEYVVEEALPDAETLASIADAVGVDVEELRADLLAELAPMDDELDELEDLPALGFEDLDMVGGDYDGDGDWDDYYDGSGFAAYDASMVHGLGAPYTMSNHTPGLGAPSTFVPGRAARQAALAGQGGTSIRQRIQSVPGVHSLTSSGGRNAALWRGTVRGMPRNGRRVAGDYDEYDLPQTSSAVAGAATRELGSFMTDLMSRKLAAARASAPAR